MENILRKVVNIDHMFTTAYMCIFVNLYAVGDDLYYKGRRGLRLVLRTRREIEQALEECHDDPGSGGQSQGYDHHTTERGGDVLLEVDDSGCERLGMLPICVQWQIAILYSRVNVGNTCHITKFIFPGENFFLLPALGKSKDDCCRAASNHRRGALGCGGSRSDRSIHNNRKWKPPHLQIDRLIYKVCLR